MYCKNFLLILLIAALLCSAVCSSGGPYYYIPYYPFVPIPTVYNSSANTSICATLTTDDFKSFALGAQDCHSIGEVALIGRYIHLGVHNQGSFGTQICLYNPFTSIPSQLGLLVDYDRNGFYSENASGPGFVGNLGRVPFPVEGDR